MTDTTKDTQVIEHESAADSEPANLPAGNSPDNLIAIAIQRDADVEKLERLMALKERWEAAEARKAFYDAMAAFQREVPEIHHNRDVDYTTKNGRTYYSFADLPGIINQIREPLARHGLSYRWEQEGADSGLIKVTCILTHSMGHCETMSLSGHPDSSGSKNSIQAVGSTVTYLKRYTLLGILGIGTAERDDDGAGARTSDSGGGDKPQKTALPPYPQEKLDSAQEDWANRFAQGSSSAEHVIAMIESKYTLSDDQKKQIRELEQDNAPEQQENDQ